MSIEVTGALDVGELPTFTADTTPAERRQAWLQISDLSEQEFDTLFAENKARQVQVPELGSEAPDFELDVLDKEQGRLQNKIRLSSLRGKPVALIFGSYT